MSSSLLNKYPKALPKFDKQKDPHPIISYAEKAAIKYSQPVSNREESTIFIENAH